MKYNINKNFALEIAQNSNGVTILKKIIVMLKDRSIYINLKEILFIPNNYLIHYDDARITQFQ